MLLVYLILLSPNRSNELILRRGRVTDKNKSSHFHVIKGNLQTKKTKIKTKSVNIFTRHFSGFIYGANTRTLPYKEITDTYLARIVYINRIRKPIMIIDICFCFFF